MIDLCRTIRQDELQRRWSWAGDDIARQYADLNELLYPRDGSTIALAPVTATDTVMHCCGRGPALAIKTRLQRRGRRRQIPIAQRPLPAVSCNRVSTTPPLKVVRVSASQLGVAETSVLRDVPRDQLTPNSLRPKVPALYWFDEQSNQVVLLSDWRLARSLRSRSNWRQHRHLRDQYNW